MKNIITSDIEKTRIESIDVFRGLTILTMVFVNDVASVRNIPEWMKHFPSNVDGMTFVDIVFPAFLFIVGMAIPFAFQKRSEKGESTTSVWGHLLFRSVGLIYLGVMMVNVSSINSEASGISMYLWMLLLYVSIILVWNSYSSVKNKFISTGIRSIGAVVLFVLMIIYRSGDGNGWLQPKWWGILGLIGLAYLTSASAYILLKKNITAMAALLSIFIFIYMAERSGQYLWMSNIGNVLWLGMAVSSHAALTTAGIVLSLIIIKYKDESNTKLFFVMSLFGLFLMVSGYLLRPYYGISKNFATPAWVFYCAGICVTVFILIYWLIDVKKFKKIFSFIKPAGSNPLLAYMLPSIIYAIIGLTNFSIYGTMFGDGWVGIIRSLVFSFFILVLTGLLTKMKIKLHL
ncbi:MAG: hypothetical protein AUK34_13960 [Ignavibacteria bacterium CG2_30_36_16]|nr:DUF5009 domain-containing protein [Ignavibacteria bacterium]OIP55138.1 MAG: hypothetical protein AUK34_13960 [Ignavibacteria bacterium CG2_30_36_16]PJA98984.1 MAG: hypothetical protein CO127_11525 [Ignavibacteria bacterium CG_4_9_14_3_um_filter_36_18]